MSQNIYNICKIFRTLRVGYFIQNLPATATIVKDPVFVLQYLRVAMSYPIILVIFDGPLLNVFAFKWKFLCISSGLKKTASHTAVQSSWCHQYCMTVACQYSSYNAKILINRQKQKFFWVILLLILWIC